MGCSNSSNAGAGAAGLGNGGTTASSGGSGNSSSGGSGNSTTGGAGGSGNASSGGSGTGGIVNAGDKSAKGLAAKLGRTNHFLIGMGNDNDGNNQGTQTFSTLGVTMDLHYLYITAGWSNWVGGGGFVDPIIDTAESHGTTPMVTYYGFDDGSVSELADTAHVQQFWDETAILFQHIAAKNKPILVHFNPDFWGFIQFANAPNGNTAYPAPVKINSRCTDLPDTIAGFGKCIVRMARQIAPKAIIGFHASAWYGWDSGTSVGNFLKACGAGDTDVIVVETSDRDAGCFEAKWPNDGRCAGGCTGCYWPDATYTQHLNWVKTVSQTIGVPALWWQTPFGVPSTTPGGTQDHWRDNRVQYFFGHIANLIAAGGVGAVFGTGAGGQTYITTDNNQFKNAVQAYFAAPTPLP